MVRFIMEGSVGEMIELGGRRWARFHAEGGMLVCGRRIQQDVPQFVVEAGRQQRDCAHVSGWRGTARKV